MSMPPVPHAPFVAYEVTPPDAMCAGLQTVCVRRCRSDEGRKITLIYICWSQDMWFVVCYEYLTSLSQSCEHSTTPGYGSYAQPTYVQ